MLRGKIVILWILIVSSISWANDGLPPLEELKEKMRTEGLSGWVHGINPENGLQVFTLRNPNNFFDYQLMPMIPVGQARGLFSTLNRHDKIWIKGQVIENGAPLPHLLVLEAKMLEKHQRKSSHQKREPIKGQYPDIGNMNFKVHAVGESGKFLLLEKNNDLIPLFIQKDLPLVKTLFRNDIVNVSFEIQVRPGRPMHFILDEEDDRPIEVLEKMETGHGERIVLRGALVKFEKSPQIKFDIFALRDITETGFWRNFTLVNFSDPQLFKALREKAALAWAQNERCREDARNSEINRSIQVTAKGLKNVVSQNQANPQVLIQSIDDLSFEVFECNK